MIDLGMTKSKNSLLMGLPIELLDLVFSNLNRYDLTKLCRTSKTVRDVALPKLYKTVVIKVPQTWSRLPSLESLLGSNGDGLRYTTELIIDTQQLPLKDSQQEPRSSRLPPALSAVVEPNLQFCLLHSSMTGALNSLVRLIILKLPQRQLGVFDWEHFCELDISTLNLLYKRQNASLRTFFCNRISPSYDFSTSVITGLSNLSIQSMEVDRDSCRWAAAMIAENANTLNYLRLGFTTCIAADFEQKRSPQYGRLSTSFAADAKDTLSKLDPGDPLIHLSLKSLCLCGLDIRMIIRRQMALDIDFNNITSLRLESCPGLSQAFSLLTGREGSSRLALSALEDLFVRLEDPDANFSDSFERFLTSIPRLTHLKVLIDKSLAVQDLRPILKFHGGTLSTLVWDARSGPRTRWDASTSLLPDEFWHLRVISRYCPSLRTLGIPLDWKVFSSSDKYHETIRSLFTRMPCLETLNIRNLPEIEGRVAMPMNYFVKGLAAMFVDIVNQKRGSTLLKTIALGAPLYRDIIIGTHHVAHTPISDFLCFRVYSIDYDYPSPSDPSAVLSQTFKGAASTSEETPYLACFFQDYWLG